jgi:hypothetical protein
MNRIDAACHVSTATAKNQIRTDAINRVSTTAPTNRTDGARSVSTSNRKNTAANDKQSIGFFFVTFAPRGIVIAM